MQSRAKEEVLAYVSAPLRPKPPERLFPAVMSRAGRRRRGLSGNVTCLPKSEGGAAQWWVSIGDCALIPEKAFRQERATFRL